MTVNIVNGQGDNPNFITIFHVMRTGVFFSSNILPLLVAAESTLRAPGKATKTKRRMQVVTSCWLSEEMPFLSYLETFETKTSCWKQLKDQNIWAGSKRKVPSLQKWSLGDEKQGGAVFFLENRNVPTNNLKKRTHEHQKHSLKLTVRPLVIPKEKTSLTIIQSQGPFAASFREQYLPPNDKKKHSPRNI